MTPDRLAARELGTGGRRGFQKAGGLASVNALRSIMRHMSHETGNPAYAQLAEDVIKGQHALGVQEAADYLGSAEGRVVHNLSAIRTKGAWNRDDQGDIEAGAQKSATYQALAESPIWVNDIARMEETAGRKPVQIPVRTRSYRNIEGWDGLD